MYSCKTNGVGTHQQNYAAKVEQFHLLYPTSHYSPHCKLFSLHSSFLHNEAIYIHYRCHTDNPTHNKSLRFTGSLIRPTIELHKSSPAEMCATTATTSNKRQSITTTLVHSSDSTTGSTFFGINRYPPTPFAFTRLLPA